jgi:hypothetical protein
VGGEEALHLRDVHPGEQLRVAGEVADALRRRPAHPVVDAAHPGDGRGGVVGGPEGGEGQEGAGAREPAPRVALVARVPGDRRHGRRVQRLQQQRSHAVSLLGGTTADPMITVEIGTPGTVNLSGGVDRVAQIAAGRINADGHVTLTSTGT